MQGHRKVRVGVSPTVLLKLNAVASPLIKECNPESVTRGGFPLVNNPQSISFAFVSTQQPRHRTR